MTGLRERQKADRTSRILAAATRLFRETGYGAIRIEDIAQAAEVSVGTLYNYFANKGDLLLAIVSMEVEEVMQAGKAVVANPPRDIAQALAARYPAVEAMLSSEDAKEGQRAFVEKRAPRWTGK